MPNKCVVPGCRTGYASCKKKFSTFSAPKNEELREKWEKAIQPMKPLKPKHVVCEKHFSPEQIIRSYKLKDDVGNVLAEVPLKCVRLVPDAVPTIFWIKETTEISSKENSHGNGNIEVQHLNEVPESKVHTGILDNNNIHKNKTERSITFSQTHENSATKDFSEIEPCIQTKSEPLHIDLKCPIICQRDLFVELLEHPSVIKIPENWYTATPATKKCVTFYELYWKNEHEACYPAVRKSLSIDDDMKAHYSVYCDRINPLESSFPERFESLDIVNGTLQQFASLKICCGIGMFDDVNLLRANIGYTDSANQLRHNRCSIVSVKQQCDACKQVKKLICQKKLRMKKREEIENGKKRKRMEGTIENGKRNRERVTLSDEWRRKLRSQRYTLQRAKKRIQTLKGIIQSQQAVQKRSRRKTYLKNMSN